MPFPLKEGTHISVERKHFGTGYAMPAMAMATDHYSIGFVISGKRKCITANYTYSYGAGDVAMSPPYVYHRTVAESDERYERILIKYSKEFIRPFIENVGQQVFDELYEGHICHFEEKERQEIFQLFTEMEEEYGKDKPYKEFILQGMLERLLAAIWEKRQMPEKAVKNKTPLSAPVMDALTYIENYYYRDPSLAQAARAAGFSAAYFSRIFQAQMGMSYSEYLNKVKIDHVQILLTQTDRTLMEIAEETGYCHGNYLSEQFKKEVGMTPGRFRKNARKR